MPDNEEITVPADQPDPEYVDESPPAAPDEVDDPEPMQAGVDDAETDPEAEVAAGTQP